MPNTLAHVGAQGLATRTTVGDIDLKWVYLGCVIPDVPWILQRAARVALPGIDPYFLRSYVVLQASLLGCLLFSAAIALMFRGPEKMFAVLGGNTLMHLGLDAIQTKWGSGVHFWAPFFWDLTNWGVFWPESLPTYILTVSGLLYIMWNWRLSVSEPPSFTWPRARRLMGILILLGGYFIGPLFLLHEPIEANTHSLEVLRETQGRTGRPVELDRARYVSKSGGHILKHYGGQVQVEELQIQAPAIVSVRGVFTAPHKVRVNKLHVHSGGLRDYPSYLGLALIAVVWGSATLKRYQDLPQVFQTEQRHSGSKAESPTKGKGLLDGLNASPSTG